MSRRVKYTPDVETTLEELFIFATAMDPYCEKFDGECDVCPNERMCAFMHTLGKAYCPDLFEEMEDSE